MDEFMSKALYIEDTNDEIDFSTIPTSGEEYLKRVIIEARKCESVVVADVSPKKVKAQTVSFANNTGCPPAPEGYAPDQDWQKLQVAEFSDVRTKLVQHLASLAKQGVKPKTTSLPTVEKEDEWFKFIYGVDLGSKVSEDDVGSPPLLPIIASLNQYKVEVLLGYNIRWLEEGGFTTHRGKWLYALLVKLEKPLIPEMCSLLRNLARTCITLRSQLPSSNDPFLPQLNLFICLVGRYFDQTDLADQ